MSNRHNPAAVDAILLVLAVTLSGPAAAACRAESGRITNTLVELYTSEGCSSCPPADRWLSTLRGAGNVVPLAFHVDYWDYLGWRDRFATPAFTQRQKERARTSGARFLYTPQVLVGGRDFAAWRSKPGAAGIARSSAPAAGAAISIEAEAGADGGLRYRLAARLTPPTGEPAVAYLALYENGLASSVQSGENAGASLAHDFVVREWVGPLAFAADGSLDLRRELRRSDVVSARAGLAAIVETAGSGRILQALDLPLNLALCR